MASRLLCKLATSHPQLLELELTQSVLMRDTARVNRLLSHLKSTGMRLSIDDFGTGYSSLSYLKRFNVNALKIEQTFPQQAATGSTGASAARAIVGLGHEISVEVVAEGVEQPEPVVPAAVGCALFQRSRARLAHRAGGMTSDAVHR